MTDQQYLNKARERYNRFHKYLFHSELTMVHTTMYDTNIDLPAAWEEKSRIAKEMSLADLEKDLTHTRQQWFSKKRVQDLLREKQALLQL